VNFDPTADPPDNVAFAIQFGPMKAPMPAIGPISRVPDPILKGLLAPFSDRVPPHLFNDLRIRRMKRGQHGSVICRAPGQTGVFIPVGVNELNISVTSGNPYKLRDR